jgi:hypothetical protein
MGEQHEPENPNLRANLILPLSAISVGVNLKQNTVYPWVLIDSKKKKNYAIEVGSTQYNLPMPPYDCLL